MTAWKIDIKTREILNFQTFQFGIYLLEKMDKMEKKCNLEQKTLRIFGDIHIADAVSWQSLQAA